MKAKELQSRYPERYGSIWINIGTLSVQISRQEEASTINIYPLHQSDEATTELIFVSYSRTSNGRVELKSKSVNYQLSKS